MRTLTFAPGGAGPRIRSWSRHSGLEMAESESEGVRQRGSQEAVEVVGRTPEACCDGGGERHGTRDLGKEQLQGFDARGRQCVRPNHPAQYAGGINGVRLCWVPRWLVLVYYLKHVVCILGACGHLSANLTTAKTATSRRGKPGQPARRCTRRAPGAFGRRQPGEGSSQEILRRGLLPEGAGWPIKETSGLPDRILSLTRRTNTACLGLTVTPSTPTLPRLNSRWKWCRALLAPTTPTLGVAQPFRLEESVQSRPTNF